MSNNDLKNILRTVVMLVCCLEISTSASEFTSKFADNEIVNSEVESEVYKAFLNNVLDEPKPVQRTDKSGNKNVRDRNQNESQYERVLRNLRTDWEMPMKYLQERGYLGNLDPRMGSAKNDISMDAYNLINGPLLNPSTSKNVYPLPRAPNSSLLTKSDRNDRASDKKRIEIVGTITRSNDENKRDCSDPYNSLECFGQYYGENLSNTLLDKWNSWFHKNQSTTTKPPATTTTTTISPPTLSSTPHPISNKTTEVVSDLSLQDARDGLEFFKIYNDFMLTKLASKLSQNDHERRMLKSQQNQEENTSLPMLPNPTKAAPDFSRINENDIMLLKELDSCLKNKKANLDVPIIKTDGLEGTVDVPNKQRVNNTYLPTKLKFLAHLHHEALDVGRNKPLSQASVNHNGCNVDVTNLGTTN